MHDPAAPDVDDQPFAVMDCALITIASGVRAQNLKEFREGLLKAPLGSLDHHFWGRLLRPQFDEPEYVNDFASWAWRGLHDKELAERLSMVTPTNYPDQESLRQEVLEILEQRLDERELVPWAMADQQFQFLFSQTVVFDTGLRCTTPEDLAQRLRSLSTGSIYYHFIDARNRTVQRYDDFSVWLSGRGGKGRELAARLCGIDPYFSSLKELRQIIAGLFEQFFPERT